MKILWITDVHVGIKRYGYVDPVTGIHSRIVDTISSFRQAIDTALHEGVDYVVILGDVFNKRNPSNVERELVSEQLARLEKAGIETFVIVGNHDVGGISDNFSMLKHLSSGKLFVVSNPLVVYLKDDVKLICMPWLNKNKYGCVDSKSLANVVTKKIVDMKNQLSPEDVNLFAGHLTLEGGKVGSEQYFLMGGDEAIPFDILNDEIFQGVFLGHLHKYQIFEKETGAKIPIMYVGSLVRCDFNEWKEAKGVVLSEVKDGKLSSKFIRIEDRKFLKMTNEEECMESLQGSVVKYNLRIKKEFLPTIDLNQIRQKLFKEGVFYIDEISVDILDEILDKKIQFSSDLSDIKFLEKWIKEVRKLEGNLADSIIEEGKRILEV